VGGGRTLAGEHQQWLSSVETLAWLLSSFTTLNAHNAQTNPSATSRIMQWDASESTSVGSGNGGAMAVEMLSATSHIAFLQYP